MSENQAVLQNEPDSVHEFARDFVRFQLENRSLIISTARGMSVSDDAHWELVDMMKDELGSAAANASSDDADDQDDAIDEAESWVTAELSHSDESGDVAMALWLMGAKEGTAWLRANQAPVVRMR